MSGDIVDEETVILTVPDPAIIGQKFDEINIREGNFEIINITGAINFPSVITETDGGTGQTTYATGDTLYASAPDTLSKLPIGAAGTVLTVSGGLPSWSAGGIPSGCILLWSGSIASIPAGWALCDGTLGTPNLVDRFVVGAGFTYPVNSIGGFADAAVIAHDHTFSTTTSFDGSHSHINNNGGSVILGPRLNGLSQTNSAEEGAGDPNWYAANMQNAGIHNHSVNGTTVSSGISATNRNLPPYWALAYIMKL